MLSKFKKFVASLLATTTIIAVVPIIPTHIDHTTVNIHTGVYINVSEK